VWLRTAVLKQATSLGTFLSTLCHEFCHHLDFVFGFHDSWHTRGFYERAAVLYHHARGMPRKLTFDSRMEIGIVCWCALFGSVPWGALSVLCA